MGLIRTSGNELISVIHRVSLLGLIALDSFDRKSGQREL